MAKAQALAMAFGGLSSGIGAWYAAAPRHFLQTIGARPTRRRIIATRLVAAQELMVGSALMADGRATRWLASRVAGDALHGAMLALTSRSSDINRTQMRATWAAWVGITAADIAATAAASRIEKNGVNQDEPTGSSKDAAKVADGSIRRTVTINREPHDVYEYWRNLENLPTFMKHLERVDEIDARLSHWVAKAPIGTVDWDAEITDDRPGELIAWESTTGSQVWNTGEVEFRRATNDRGTEVHVRLEYSPPGGAFGAAIARILGEEPRNQIAGDLRRLKQVLETGEVIVSESVAEGGSRKQRPAQPLEMAA